MLQQALPVLHSGESTTTSIGLTVLCRGEYEVGASVEEARILRFDDHKDGHTDGHHDDGIKDTFGADVVRRRRIWHAKETCVIHARD